MRKLLGKFEMYQGKNGGWRWRLLASNGRIIADSGEDYGTRAACEKGISSVRWNATFAQVKLLT